MFDYVQLCFIGNIFGWVWLSSITQPNWSQSNDWSSITERLIYYAGRKASPPCIHQQKWLFRGELKGTLSHRKGRYSELHGLWCQLGWGADTAKITVNVWDFGPLGTTITPLQRGGFLTFANTLNGFIDIIHSTENKTIKRSYDVRKSNYKSSHVQASNFMVICIILIRKVRNRLRSLQRPKIISVQTSLKIHFRKSHWFSLCEIRLFVAAL